MSLLEEAKRLGLGWLQDIVPNHLAADVSNPFWNDVLTFGRDSCWAQLFDLDWEVPGHAGRILLPILSQPYATSLVEPLLAAACDERGLYVEASGQRRSPGPRNAGSRW